MSSYLHQLLDYLPTSHLHFLLSFRIQGDMFILYIIKLDDLCKKQMSMIRNYHNHRQPPFSGRPRGGSAGSLETPPYPLFLNIQ